jgi:hypothetical protein
VVEIYALQILAATLAGGPRWRRALALAVGTPALFVAWQLDPAHTLWRAMVTLAASVAEVRLLEQVFARREVPALRRVWQTVALVDTTRLKYGPPALDGAALLRAVGYGALTLGSAWVAFDVGPSLTGAARLLARLGGGVVFVYALTDTGYATFTLLFRALGIIPYELHRAPVLARSVQEFWGDRWARTVSILLYERTFKPLARRRMPRLGLAASFLASGLGHAWIILPALGWMAAGLWGGYFVVQGALVIVERAMRVARWPAPLAHAWVATVMLGTSPLMVLPTLRAFEGAQSVDASSR